ncbi:bifunctional adenosylcobinamide kinase/adenosylcobinamide-phosphate guanylyltransferase [Halobacillus sp. B23F22_1]|uniref:bifunctional adenosylcobinamide kinase/adenosylcobinamide-phosphate guanylyltransferase n=1 Tax=Halobacillus sp. B23F22_1 TaxID=3459514 RepID=UPI00373EF081
MDFITGGAHNGKLAWALQHYEGEATVIRAREAFDEEAASLVIVDQVETIIGEWSSAEEFFQKLVEWELRKEVRQLVFIGTDITSGIVPVEAKERQWRDEVGFQYQQFMKDAETVYRIWFGIPQQLK